MKNAFRYFGLMSCVVGVVAATAVAGPTFSFKLAGVNGVLYRDIDCSENGDLDCPTGSHCEPVEMIFPGNFVDRCSPICELVDGECTVPAGVVEPGDIITVEAYIKGWDTTPELGYCNGEEGEECNVTFNDCQYAHCEPYGGFCSLSNPRCGPGQTCVPDTCLEDPLLGLSQWVVDSSTYASLTVPLAGPFALADLRCGQDSDCRHGYTLSTQCTCTSATCMLGGHCSITAMAYLEKVRFDYLFWDVLHQSGVEFVTDDFQYWGAVTPDLNPATRDGIYDMGRCEGGSDDGRSCFFGYECYSGVCRQYPRYVGTLWLQAPMTAAGDYTIDFVRNPNYTFASTELAVKMEGTEFEPLTIEMCDPCRFFDVNIECPEPPNVCTVYECFPRDCVGTCSREPRTCEDPCERCVVAEGGCVPFGTCCIEGVCSERSEQQCMAAGGESWTACETCGPFSCMAVGACCTPIGEGEFDCEDDVYEINCDGDFYAGRTCAENPCVPTACPVGVMNYADPEDGTIDARQPRKVDDAAFLQGIDTIMASGPAGASDLACWSLCETLSEGLDNYITGVTEGAPGDYTITLNRRITPGAVTKITYTDGGGVESKGTFVSLPADSNADGVANTVDILALIDCCLNQVCTPPWGVYSCDIDQSLVVNSADILRLIDLLNGAGQFLQQWNLERVYDGGECP